MLRSRMAAAALLAGALFVVSVPSASADKEKQKEKGGQAPEVPATAGLPVAAAIGAGAYYVLARRRRHALAPAPPAE